MLTDRYFRTALFLLLTYTFSSFFYVPIVSTGKMEMLPVFGLMWCPGAAALILRLALQRNLRGIGWTWKGTRWQVFSYLLPPVLGMAAYGSVWITGIGGFNATGLASRGVGSRIRGKKRGQTNLSLTTSVQSVRYGSVLWTDPSVPVFCHGLLA